MPPELVDYNEVYTPYNFLTDDKRLPQGGLFFMLGRALSNGWESRLDTYSGNHIVRT